MAKPLIITIVATLTFQVIMYTGMEFLPEKVFELLFGGGLILASMIIIGTVLGTAFTKNCVIGKLLEGIEL